MNRFYLTTSIPYVNANPHIGFALELLQADALARWHRQQGHETYFLTGTDENALKNVQAAESSGKEVAEFVAEHAEKFRDLGKVLNTSSDDFIRTTEERHIHGAQKLWKAMDPQDIYRKEYSGLYCVGCESFITEKDLEEGVCPVHKTKPEQVTENNYFFRLSNYQDKLLKLIEGSEFIIVPDFRRNEVIEFIKRGLEDISISRSVARAHGWGVPVPDDRDQIMYVWVDALSNYITALGYGNEASPTPPSKGGDKKSPPYEGGGRGGLFQKWWQEADSTHLVGKDIIRFHAIYWPSFLLSAKLPIPKRVMVHGFIGSEGQKMSKSLGNVISPFVYAAKYGVDALRYYLLREIPTLDDGDFTEELFLARYQSDLANGLGNLVQRVTAMVEKYIAGKINGNHGEGGLQEKVNLHIQNFSINKALDEIWTVIANTDKRISDARPWELAKDEEKKEELAKLLSELIQDIRGIGVALTPFLPETANSIIKIVDAEKITPPEKPLFPRVQI